MSEMVTKSNFENSSPVYIEEFKDTKPVSRRTDNIMINIYRGVIAKKSYLKISSFWEIKKNIFIPLFFDRHFQFL
jgi:hypothetical protein